MWLAADGQKLSLNLAPFLLLNPVQLPVDTFKYELKREYISQLTFLYIRPLNTFGTGYDEI